MRGQLKRHEGHGGVARHTLDIVAVIEVCEEDEGERIGCSCRNDKVE